MIEGADEEVERKSSPTLSDIAARLRHDLNDDKDLTKQALADYNALERQQHQQWFEARKEYARQVTESRRDAWLALKEYGLQTLKWAFLLNAGAAGLILAYIGAKGGISDPKVYVPIVRALWPFAAGCLLVGLAGAAGYFNFCYAELQYPSAHALHNFFNIHAPAKEWPRPMGADHKKPLPEFGRWLRRRLNFTRGIAITCAVLSFGLFGYGLWRVLRIIS